MKVIGLITITDPDYRQDPARECILQALEVCDEVVVVYGKVGDAFIVEDRRVWYEYLPWPHPRWTLDELPRHLNYGLTKARELGADWIIKYDADCLIHEKHKWEVRNKLEAELETGVLVMELEKVHCITPTRALMKNDIQVCIKGKSDVWFGQSMDEYTDLCKPILWDLKKVERGIPLGESIGHDFIKRTGAWMWNYGYMFKTETRSRELLYYFDLAHAEWWGVGWQKQPKETITEESAMEEHLAMMRGRYKRATKELKIDEHPKHIQEKLRALNPEQFGHSLWGKIEMII